MSGSRPTTCPQLIATVIESAPDRVRRRLDRSPDAAAEWDWQQAGESWSVDTGGETVSIAASHVDLIDHVSCSCLLSPRCFHVLACLSSLEVATGDPSAAMEDADPDDQADEQRVTTTRSSADELIELNERQRGAIREFSAAINQLMRVGVANCGIIVQSSLLRAVHQCRAEGLHRSSAIGLRIIAGTNQFRTRSPESDPMQLAEDVASALEIIAHLNQENVPAFWLGTARRKQYPIRPRKLHGLLAEPIIARSGYAGAVAYFLGEDECIYTASEVKPGDAQLARDAYLGGIEIGPLIQPAKQLARQLYVGSQMTASDDGRLGRGKSIKFAQQGASTWEADAVQKRFAMPVSEQFTRIYDHASLPEDVRPAGWDFVFATGTILAAAGPDLLLQLDGEDKPLRLAIANESDVLFFRDNLQMLSHAAGIRLRVIGRLELEDLSIVYALAIAADNNEDLDTPKLELPDALDGRLFLGLDELKRSHLRDAASAPCVMPMLSMPVDTRLLSSLQRRWLAGA